MCSLQGSSFLLASLDQGEEVHLGSPRKRPPLPGRDTCTLSDEGQRVFSITRHQKHVALFALTPINNGTLLLKVLPDVLGVFDLHPKLVVATTKLVPEVDHSINNRTCGIQAPKGLL